jgi:hypothetical protein
MVEPRRGEALVEAGDERRGHLVLLREGGAVSKTAENGERETAD